MARTEGGDAAPLRTGLLLLAVLSVLATLTELGLERHWKANSQVIPWITLTVIGLLAVALLLRPGRGLLRLARVLGLLVLLSSAFGVFVHIESNYEAGELDQRYAATWETLPPSTRWWLAITHEVGPSPPLAPAASAYAALTMLLATVAHPARRMKNER